MSSRYPMASGYHARPPSSMGGVADDRPGETIYEADKTNAAQAA